MARAPKSQPSSCNPPPQTKLDLLASERMTAIRMATCGSDNDAVWKVSWAFRAGSGTTPSSDRRHYFDGPHAWVNSGDLNDGIIEYCQRTVTDEALRDFSALKTYDPGALLVAMYGATIGKTGILGMTGCVNQAICVLQPIGPVLTSYAHYWFIGQRERIIELGSGGGQPNINQDVIKNLGIPCGDIPTQSAIVAGLNRMSAMYDENRETLGSSIDLLQEFKRSLISAAVSGEFDVSTASGRGVPA